MFAYRGNEKTNGEPELCAALSPALGPVASWWIYAHKSLVASWWLIFEQFAVASPSAFLEGNDFGHKKLDQNKGLLVEYIGLHSCHQTAVIFYQSSSLYSSMV